MIGLTPPKNPPTIQKQEALYTQFFYIYKAQNPFVKLLCLKSAYVAGRLLKMSDRWT